MFYKSGLPVFSSKCVMLGLAPILPPKTKILLILVKNCWRIEIKTFPHFALSHEN